MTDSDEAPAFYARLAMRFGNAHCQPGPAGCDWYHPVWPLFRGLGLVRSSLDHYDFYASALGGAHFDERREVLISGCADHATLQTAFQILGPRHGYTVLDRCATPLALCRAYAERVACTVSTYVDDIFSHRRHGAYDVVTTHSFLTFFTHGERAALFEKWHALLKPGGKVVSVQRLRPGPDDPGRFTAAQASRFTQAVTSRADDVLPDIVEEYPLRQLAENYTRRFTYHPVRDAAALHAQLAAAGFTVERWFPDDRSAGAPSRAEDGPSTHGAGEMFFFVATRH